MISRSVHARERNTSPSLNPRVFNKGAYAECAASRNPASSAGNSSASSFKAEVSEDKYKKYKLKMSAIVIEDLKALIER